MAPQSDESEGDDRRNEGPVEPRIEWPEAGVVGQQDGSQPHAERDHGDGEQCDGENPARNLGPVQGEEDGQRGHARQQITFVALVGQGEDGEDGGDGCDGKDGVGVEKQDLDKLVVKYQSIYRDSWTQFYDYSPPSNWIKQSGSSSSGDYIYRTYKDENGREMTYSFASDKGWVYTTYELFFLIRGSNGTMGSSGGSNGVGGQGGYNGTCLVRNPETNEEFQISLIKECKSNGYNGENGKVGKSGKHGLNGNDMVLIDRSAKEASKHYIGILDRKLSWNYNYKSEDKNRLDGYKRYSEKENACFRKFQYGETIDRSEERASRAQAQTVRKTLSEAVAKQSIVLSKVLAETESLFEKQNAFLADACEASSKASLANDADEEEQEETNENVTEEVVILRQKEDTKSLLLKYTSQSNQKVS